MNAVIERIYRTGLVEDAQGRTYPHDTSAVFYATGKLLYDHVRSARPARTLEIGLAYGVSTLFICQALRDNGAGAHTAIDPLEASEYHSIGLTNVERAGLSDLFRFYKAPSAAVLPQLHARRERFDFAFVDGRHHFDYALVDLFYVDQMLPVGGCVAVDDLWMPGVRKAASFLLRNRPYVLVPTPAGVRTPVPQRWLNLGRRVLQNPLGWDWPLKLVPQNVALLRKVGDDDRVWDHHRPF
ncbi:MAG: class I SAM-dependent methyltransferase [Rhodothermales bacterium]|nr:class I SAM-dependent methyltransferase [Rhodothermales bacterium]